MLETPVRNKRGELVLLRDVVDPVVVRGGGTQGPDRGEQVLADARPAVAAVETVEVLENLLVFILGDADALIGHRDGDQSVG